MRDAGCLEAYCPVDISEEITRETAARIAGEYEDITVAGHVCDFEADLERVPVEGPRLIALLGGTIGNFAPAQRAQFLRRIANLLDSEDRFLLGTDLVKARETLEAAYDDARGVTAEFNRNVLVRLNREFDADFSLDHFVHRATWNDAASRIEMHLVSLADQVVTVAGMAIAFEAGETIWTESSYKYDRQRLESLAASAGWHVTELWTDPAERFWVGYLETEVGGR